MNTEKNKSTNTLGIEDSNNKIELPKRRTCGTMEVHEKLKNDSAIYGENENVYGGNKMNQQNTNTHQTETKGGMPNKRTCGTIEVHEELLKKSKRYADARKKIESEAQNFLRTNRILERQQIVKIPVVVHVVWNAIEENIPDTQIQSQIDILNRDYRKKNSDVSKVPEVWKDLVGDARIEFYLANIDPEGNQSNGITRTQSSVEAFNHLADDVKSVAKGGVDPWPSDRYLNIWVCRLNRGLLGYSQFPGGPPETDGVVIGYTYFGTNGTATHPFHLGRTATHEIGHWLNLNHIWGDDMGACSGSDNVSDTPNQGDSNDGSPDFPHITCDNGPNGDMFMNYMDYVNDDSMFMFTVEQVIRMEACLQGPRSSFLNN